MSLTLKIIKVSILILVFSFNKLIAAKEQKYSDKYETYMKMLEIMNSKDLFMDISPSNSKIKEEKHLKPANEDKAIVNWTLES